MLRRGRSGHSPSMRPTIVIVVEVAEAGRLIVEQMNAVRRRTQDERLVLDPAADGGREIGDRPRRIVVGRVGVRERARTSSNRGAARGARVRRTRSSAASGRDVAAEE